ncbi:MAG: phosphoadenylyl-sulfate reductase [Bacteroidales bacterium]|jgi:phosphoadenosine phosphosulfate reductase|nr:phosphoadenylyl-sulfate reductase [Bacteroidales bacterium]
MKQEDINQLNQTLAKANAEKILTKVAALFPGKIKFASSLGYEDQIITHFIAKKNLPIPIFTLDTGRLFPETYDLIDRTVARYKTNIEVYFPDYKQVEEMVNQKGINLFYHSVENRKLCCGVRKTEPLKRALSGLDAWITGLRREQAVTRTHMQAIEWDAMHGLIKVNPLINWTVGEVEQFIKKEGIPYNKLHDKGFPSIGCQPCTRAIEPGEDIRAGRWWWEQPEQKECGLHKS